MLTDRAEGTRLQERARPVHLAFGRQTLQESSTQSVVWAQISHC